MIKDQIRSRLVIKELIEKNPEILKVGRAICSEREKHEIQTKKKDGLTDRDTLLFINCDKNLS